MFRDRHFHRSGRWHTGIAPVAPVISNVTEVAVADTTATISWNVDRPATGVIEYGTTTAYGSSTTTETSLLTYHVQTITGLSAGTVYHYNIVSIDSEGTPASAQGTFETTGASFAGVYGAALNMDTKSNRTIAPGRDCLGLSFRWRATQSSTPVSFTVQYRTSTTNPAYSGGTWGTYQVRLCDDNGSGLPDETSVIAERIVVPATFGQTSGAIGVRTATFTSSGALVSGTLYHLVFRNVDASPSVNYLALNNAYMFGGITPRQPKWPDTDMGTLQTQSTVPNTSWAIAQGQANTPILDIAYANGKHDGQAFMSSANNVMKSITGDTWAGELFTPPVTLTVTDIYWRFGNESGSGDATLRLETAAGVLVDEGTVTGSGSFASANPGADAAHGTWGSTSVTATLTAGTQYRVCLSSPAGTVMSCSHPMTDEYDSLVWAPHSDDLVYASQHPAGVNQMSADAGSSWTDIDYYDSHFQWYLVVA